MRVARVLAQAKLNLWLSVGPRDASGYHEIATLFHRIDLADEVTVRVGGSVRAIDVSGPRVPPGGLGSPQKNLAYRAAAAYAEQASWLRGFALELTKHIPTGAGLGGGSADAGAVLRALDELAPEPLGVEALLRIAATLGADVPFLTSDSVAAVGTRRGELLRPVTALESRPVLVIVPDFAIATADAYAWLDEWRSDGAKPPVSPPGVDWPMLAKHSRNDFEPAIDNRFPDLRAFRETLVAAGASVARLAGSGSSVFGIFDDEPSADAVAAIPAETIATRSSTRVVQVEVAE